MNPERDTTSIVRSWLEHGVTDLPDRVQDRVLDQLPSTPQRRHRWQARRSTRMNATLKVATVAAAVVVVGVIGLNGLNLLPGAAQPGVGAAGTPAPTPTASPPAAPSASPIPVLSYGPLEPGRYRIGNLSILVPAGWHGLMSDVITKDYGGGTEPGAAFAVWSIAGTYVDPCTDHTLVQPTRGPGIDELADALANQPGTTAGPPTAIMVDGYPAKVVESTVTADIAQCLGGTDGFWLWAGSDREPRYVQGTGEVNRIYIVDVNGERLTFNGRIPAVTTAADRAELEAIIASIDIEP